MTQKKGIWIEVVGKKPALECPERLGKALSYCKKHGITDIFLQVVRSGRAWLESDHLDLEPFKRCLKAHGGRGGGGGGDPVKNALLWGKENGVRIHLWCNIFCLGESEPAPWVRELPAESFVRDSFGNTTTEKAPAPLVLDAPALWLDPASDELFEFYKKVFSDIATRYSQAAGIHLDFFRYPYYLPIKPSSAVHLGSDFGYSTPALKRFQSESGIVDPFITTDGQMLPKDYDTAIEWDHWRRAQVERYLELFGKQLGSHQSLSVACLAWPDRAYMSSFQNWRKWLKEELIDIALPMIYTADDELFSHLIEQASAFTTKKNEVLAGVGAYIFRNRASLQAQLEIVDSSDIAGHCLFSYRNLLKKKWEL